MTTKFILFLLISVFLRGYLLAINLEGEVPTYLFASNAKPAVIIQFGEHAEGANKGRFDAFVAIVKSEFAPTGIKMNHFYLVESKSETFFNDLNAKLDKGECNYKIKIIVKDFPADVKAYSKSKNYKNVSMFIQQKLRALNFTGMQYGTYLLENYESFNKLAVRFEKDLKSHEPEYFDKTMYIPKTITVVDNKSKTYSNFPSDLKKSRLLFVKLDPYDSPDWKYLNEIHSAILKEKLKIPYLEVRKNQVDEYEEKGYHYLIEHYTELAFSEKDPKVSKSKDGLKTKYYYYLRDVDDDHKYSVKDLGHDTITEALHYLLDSINKEIK